MNKHDWTYKKLGETCLIERGGSPRPIQQYLTDKDDGLNWIKIGDAVEGSKYITSTKEKIKPEGLKKTRFVHKGDFILSNSMSFGKPYILSIDGCIHDGWLVIRDDSGTFNKSFLYYMLSSPNMYQEFRKLAVGGVVNNLNSSIVRNVVVPIPPMEEQERIVEELDLLSGVIEKKKEQLKAYDQLAQSIFYTMFGDPITNEKGWEIKTIEDICTSIVRGPFGSALKKEFFVEPDETTFKIYEQKHAIQKNATIGSYYITKEKFKELSRFELRPYDIIMSCSGTIGELYRLPSDAERGIMNQALLKFTLNTATVCYEFFMYMMDYMKQYFVVRGSGLQNIGSVKIIKSMPFGVPPLALQQEFAEKIEGIEAQKALIQHSIKETEMLFNSRMDYYFN